MSFNCLTVVEKWLVIGQFCRLFFSTVSGFLNLKFCVSFLFLRSTGIVGIVWIYIKVMNTCCLFDEFNRSIITKIPLGFPRGSLITTPQVVSNDKKQSYSLNTLSQQFSPCIACCPSLVCTCILPLLFSLEEFRDLVITLLRQ